jgi:hypothetical protein
MSHVLTNKDITTINGILLNGEMSHFAKFHNGVWQCVFEGHARTDELIPMFKNKPTTVNVINIFFEGEFNYSLKIISEPNDVVKFRLIIKEREL